MTRRDRRPTGIERERLSAVEAFRRWSAQETPHDRARPFTPDPDRDDMVWSTPPVGRPPQPLRVMCDRCQTDLGGVFLETYTDGSKGLLAVAAELALRDGVPTAIPRRTRLDREGDDREVTFWCRYPRHGVAVLSSGTLMTRSLIALQRMPTRRAGASSDVLEVICSPLQ